MLLISWTSGPSPLGSPRCQLVYVSVCPSPTLNPRWVSPNFISQSFSLQDLGSGRAPPIDLQYASASAQDISFVFRIALKSPYGFFVTPINLRASNADFSAAVPLINLNTAHLAPEGTDSVRKLLQSGPSLTKITPGRLLNTSSTKNAQKYLGKNYLRKLQNDPYSWCRCNLRDILQMVSSSFCKQKSEKTLKLVKKASFFLAVSVWIKLLTPRCF